MMYRIDDLDFQLNPLNKFSIRGGGETTYAEYYEKKYNKKLRNLHQPLIVNRKKKGSDEVIYLIPELCIMTGQSDEMRQNFQLQKDLNQLIKPNPQKRLKECQKLIDLIKTNEKTKDLLKKWAISIEVNPVSVDASKLDAGNIIMGRDNQFPLDNTPDFDRKIQTEMFSQVQLKKIALFCNSRDRDVSASFMSTLKESVKTFHYPMDSPKEFFIDGRNFEDWERQFKKYLDDTVQAVILLLPGKKKAAPFYDNVKKYLLTKCPIPSQVVLVPTIQNGKNTRSIVNKILIQLCAKVGGIPWSVKDFPFVDKPTMIVGIDVLHKPAMKNKSLLSFCGTTNKSFSRYFSSIDLYPDGEDMGKAIQATVKNAILAFGKTNKVLPARLIVYRDGVSDSQRKVLEEREVKAFLRAFDDLIESKEINAKPELIFICVNKKVATKFFTGDNLQREGLGNPEQGTVVSSEVTTGNDFYLISQKTTQGSAAPTHYFVLSHYVNGDDGYVDKTKEISEKVMVDIQKLTYKLCYMYYNWSGSIKVPAPIQYAQKLSTLIGDRWKPDNQMIPDKLFEKLQSLYYI